VGYHKWLRFTWLLLIILLVLYATVLSIVVFVPWQVFWPGVQPNAVGRK
jgi:hypothetical protein